MAKKTLFEIGKIILAAIIAFLLSAAQMKRGHFQDELDSKLEKEEYYQDKSDHERLHDGEQRAADETKQMVRDIYIYLLNKKPKYETD